ncbi:chymotrypsin-2 [Aethina tumida]|uniref:chymotrypsin-2 n=1 Tax=Aethina tumida TaxID=116153 RepID=UPI00096B00D8|nr:chymotrypsin-2 [Aethina tumida]
MYFLLIVSLCIAGSLADSRIVNGTNAEEGEFPYAVSLRYNNSHTCGGTILNEKFILTAAHCVCRNSEPRDASLYSIQYDVLNITREPVNVVPVETINCNKFSSQRLIYDVAVLELASPIPAGKWTPVELATELNTGSKQKGVIIGWGRIYHGGPLARTLQKMDVDVFTDKICGRRFDNHHHVCFGAGVGGACNGDSGTALMVDGKQAGIASFITRECGIATEDYPNVYSRVPSYHKWIADIAGL